VDQLSHEEFAEAIRPLFESAPLLTTALFGERPFSSWQELISRAELLTQSMPFDEQVGVLAAHPRIGTHPAALSALSSREQGSEDPQWVYDQLAHLNQEYEGRFGFRFVVFVNKRPKSEILEVLRGRLNNSPEEELATGLRDMFRIARDRLCSLTT
jgi:2-oxo-4-hydroxy-4-carboxy--5-ureidoimidazoline (OHCU) decarboxylase